LTAYVAKSLFSNLAKRAGSGTLERQILYSVERDRLVSVGLTTRRLLAELAGDVG
jgi:hypothetical protein